MDKSAQGFRVRLAKAAALLVFVGSAAPQALAQLLPPLPLPGGSLIVTITSPGSGATVSGATSATASTSDNVGVVGVQFRLDGSNLGAEDTTAPYSVSWNTTTTGNGSHTLSAVARDAAGNVSPVSAVTVTVNNAPPPPPPDTRSEERRVATAGRSPTAPYHSRETASASDNDRVVGVQFRQDCANPGAEDTTATYSVSWNTTTTGDGSHTLTAVARDAAGNVSPVSAVTVTVNNAPPPPPPDT